MSISIKHACVGLFFLMLLVGVASSALGQATVSTDKENYASGDTVFVTGTGWLSGEVVSLTIFADSSEIPRTILYALAADDGNISNREFIIGEDDSDTGFLLRAQGQTSGLSAQTTFFDGVYIKSVWVSPQSPRPVQAGGSATYTVSVEGTVMCMPYGCWCRSTMAYLTITTPLPPGVTYSFNPGSVYPRGSYCHAPSTLTLTTSATTPSGLTSFTVLAYAGPSEYATRDAVLEVLQSDTTPPVPDVDPLPAVSGQCSATIASAPTASDDVTGPITGTTSDPTTYTVQGSYTVHWTYTDAAGNSSYQEQQVIVQDTTAPELTCPSNRTFLHGQTIDFGQAVGTDACDADVTITFTDVTTPGTCPEDYTTARTWKGTDDTGNFSTCAQTVTVLCPGAAPVGSDVVAQPVDSTTGTTPVTLTFDSVSVGGMTALVISGVGAPPDFGFALGSPPAYYELTTTAVFTDSVTICIDYSGISFGNKSALSIRHREDGAWALVPTLSHDIVEEIICGRVASLSAFAIFEKLVPAIVDIDPDVLNPRSGGRWVTSYIELPEGYDPEDIDVSTVMVNEAVSAELSPTSVGDYDSDGVMDRTVKFSRPAVIGILPNGEYVEVRIMGQVGDNAFAGKDTIRVLMPKLLYPNGGQALQAGKQYTVSWEVPGGYTPDYYHVFYTTDDGTNWNVVAEHVTGTSCTWAVPAVPSAACRVLVEAYDELGIMGYDVSDKTFALSSTITSRPRDGTPISFDLRLASLNPSVSGATLEFDLPEASHVRVVVFDVGGRLVKQLVDESRPVGSYVIQWDGRNASGQDVQPGIYVVRLDAGGFRFTHKVVMVHR